MKRLRLISMSSFQETLNKLLLVFDNMTHKGTESTCPICLDAIKEGDGVFRMKCKHLFHVVCLTTWMKVDTTCPMCKQTMTIFN